MTANTQDIQTLQTDLCCLKVWWISFTNLHFWTTVRLQNIVDYWASPSDYEEPLVQKIPHSDIKTNSMHNIFNAHSQSVKNGKTAPIRLNSDNWLNKGVSEQWQKKYKFGKIPAIVVAEYEKFCEQGKGHKRGDRKICLFASQWLTLPHIATASNSGPRQLLLFRVNELLVTLQTLLR